MMYTRTATSSSLTAATLSIAVTMLTLTCTSALTIRPDNPALSKRFNYRVSSAVRDCCPQNDPAVIHDPTADPRPVCQRVQCHGNLPPLISSTGVRNYPVNYDHPFAIWRDLEHYCNSWGSSNLFHDPGGAGCSCVLPGHPAYVLLPVNSHPICRGGAYNIPGYDAFAFNNAPATELCRQVCTCVDAPQISPPDLSRVEPNQPRIVPQGPVRPQDPVRPQRGPIDPNHPQVVPS